jgi:uncharacterized phage protein gp47/JayE
MSFGITPTGFKRKTLNEIRLELEDFWRSAFGAGVNLLAGSVNNQIIGLLSERESLIWGVLEATYANKYPDTASGVGLDNAVAFTGIRRILARQSVSPGQLFFGDVGTLITPSARFSVLGAPNLVFAPVASVTLVAGSNAEQEISFSAVPDSGDFTLTFKGETTAPIAWDDDASDLEAALEALSTIDEVTVTGDFAAGFIVEFEGLDGLQPQPLLEATSALLDGATPVDIDVEDEEVGVPQGQVDLEAVNDGPLNAPVGTLTVIDTPISGLDRTTNPTQTILGRNRETDAELRQRRDLTLTVAGSATVNAIRSRMLAIPGVTSAGVFENTTLVTDGDGRPGKSYEVVVAGGDTQTIGDVIWDSKPAGIETFGSELVNVEDNAGNPQVVNFSRPTLVPIFVSVDLTVGSTFPGANFVEAAIFDFGQGLGLGQDIIVFPRFMCVFSGIPGIENVRVRIDTSAVSTTPGAPAVDANIPITAFQLATFDLANINVNVL